MITIDNYRVIMFDVDDTLIMNVPSDSLESPVMIKDPWEGDNKLHSRLVHTEHVEALKDYKKQGYSVMVWSAGGGQWAANTVEALGLTEYVDLCFTKPTTYFDDLSVNSWMPFRIYLKKE